MHTEEESLSPVLITLPNPGRFGRFARRTRVFSFLARGCVIATVVAVVVCVGVFFHAQSLAATPELNSLHVPDVASKVPPSATPMGERFGHSMVSVEGIFPSVTMSVVVISLILLFGFHVITGSGSAFTVSALALPVIVAVFGVALSGSLFRANDPSSLSQAGPVVQAYVRAQRAVLAGEPRTLALEKDVAVISRDADLHGIDVEVLAAIEWKVHGGAHSALVSKWWDARQVEATEWRWRSEIALQATMILLLASLGLGRMSALLDARRQSIDKVCALYHGQKSISSPPA